MKKINELMPREQANTSKNYNYQYTELARSSLKMLEDGEISLFYSEWHDDFVEERTSNNVTHYDFVQVKGRKISKSAYGFNDFFGITFLSEKKIKESKRIVYKRKISDKSIFLNQMVHHFNFGQYCKKLTLHTNHEIKPELEKFLEQVNTIKLNELEKDDNFKSLHSSYLVSFPKLTNQALYEILLKVQLKGRQGSLDDFLDPLITDIWNVLEHIKEDSAKRSFVRTMALNLKRKAEERGEHTINIVPVDQQQLKESKGITLFEVLEEVGISKDIFEMIKSDDPNLIKEDLVKTTRIQRICEGSDFIPEEIVFACNAKVEWENWASEMFGDLLGVKLREINFCCSEQLKDHLNPKINKKLSDIYKYLKDKLYEENMVVGLNDDNILSLAVGCFYSYVSKCELFK